MENAEFEILKVSELKKILDKEKRDLKSFNYQLKTNNAFCYVLDDSSVILMPNRILDTNNGLLFKDFKSYEFYLKNDSFPINEEKNIYYKLNSEILDLKLEISKILVKEKSKIDIKKNQRTDIFSTLESLLIEYQQKWNFLTYEEKFYSLVILGEYLRIMNKAKWMLIKKYGAFNPFFVPVILFDNGNFINITESGEFFFKNKSLSIETFRNWDENTNPKNNRTNTYAHEIIIIE